MDKWDSRLLIRESFLTILPAQLLAALIPYLSGIINGVVIGNFYDENMISVIGFTTPVVYFLTAVRTLFAVGGASVAGNFMGQGRHSKVNETYRLCIKTLMLTGLVMTGLVHVFTGTIAGIIAKDGALLGETEKYLMGLSIGFIPCLLISLFSVYLQLAGESKKVISSALLNAGLNLIFDLAAVTIFDAGIKGIGLATALAQWLTAAYLVISIRKTGFVKFSTDPSDIRILQSVSRAGISACILLLMEAARNSILVERSFAVGGYAASDTTSILFSASGIVDFITTGFVVSAGMVASLYAGEENEEGLIGTARWGTLVGSIAGILSGTLLFILAKPVALAFGSRQAGLELAVICLRTYAVYIMIANPFQIMLRIYQVLKRVKVNFAMMFIKEILISIPVIYLLGDKMGAKGLWACFPIGAAFGTLMIVVISAYMSRKQGRKHLDYLWYNENEIFDDSENCYITNYKDMTAALRSIENFCRRNRMDKKSSMACRLLSEENMTRLLEHGVKFSKKRELLINLFAGTDGEKTRLVFQDNSQQFDPFKRFRMYEEDDDELIRDASVSIVQSLSSDITYQFSFGMNILMIDMLHEGKGES